MERPKCIFCFEIDDTMFNTKEHIIPESLGGGDWAILPPGLFCDKCQNKFGSSIEQQALDVYPLSYFRTFMGIPTKKGKAPWFSSWEGKIESAGRTGTINYDPNNVFSDMFKNGDKSIFNLPAMPEKTDMVLRMLLKIGLETFAADLSTQDAVFENKFDPARVYALTGEKNSPWFYIVCEDPDKLNHYLKGISQKEWLENFYADVYEEEDLIYLHLKLLYLDFFTPLVDNVEVDEKLKGTIVEPIARIVYV